MSPSDIGAEGDRHPVTGRQFASPAPAGAGWPGDPATSDTAVAHSFADVERLAAQCCDLAALDACISVCRACPRLVAWRETVARTGRRASLADQPYWGRPGPSFGDPHAKVLLVGLAPAANGTNRTGRMFTGDSSGDFLWSALYRTGWASQGTSVAAGDGQTLTGMRIVAAVRCAPPANKPASEERATCQVWLERDVTLALPWLESIVCLGALAWNAMLATAQRLGWDGARPRPRFGHGTDIALDVPGANPIRLVGCYHVSPHNTYTGRLTPQMLDEILLSVRDPGTGPRAQSVSGT